MAKNSIRDYSATNSSNTDIQSIDISEGCSPAGINNAIREVMADLKDVSTGAVALESPAMDSLTVDTTTLVVDAVNNRVGVGTVSPATPLHISGAAAASNYATRITNTATDGYSTLQLFDDQAGIYRAGSGVSAYGGASSLNILTVGAYPVTLGTSNTVRMTVAGSGNVGIGTASPTKKVSANIGLNDTDGYVLEYSGDAKGGILLNPISGEVRMGALNSSGTYFTTLYANNSEAVRIDSSGGVKINTTANVVGGGEYLSVAGGSGSIGVGIAGTNTNPLAIWQQKTGTNTAIIFFSQAGGNNVGAITVGTTSTAYNTTSDYRLKENVTDITDATTRLKQLNPVRFNFIAEPDTTVDGFLAHEVAEHVPEAISGTKDGMCDEEYEVTPAVLDEDGNEVTPAVMGTRSVPDYQGIDQSKLVPLLVKTIQELEARITALEAN